MYRAADEDGNLVAPLAAFMRAKADRPPGAPYVISCSWGGDSHGPLPHLPTGMERAMALEILDAIEQGIVVVFAAGNGGHSIEPQVPGVISAGAAHVNVKLEVRASDIGSAYTSEWQPGLTVPTICGLVGMRPRGLYILLPVAPNKEIDRESSAPKQPQDGPPQPGDDTAPSDGWALLSGTSVAAPQIAGAVAILLGERADLKHADIIALFKDSAIDIRSGWVNPNFTRLAGKADDGTDIATGLGLVDVGKALELLRSA
jgi:subtilisin family serine protease